MFFVRIVWYYMVLAGQVTAVWARCPGLLQLIRKSGRVTPYLTNPSERNSLFARNVRMPKVSEFLFI